MAHSFRDDLAVCLIDGHPIFLDVAHDRYFRVPDDLEPAVVTLIAGGECAEPDIQRLIRSNILSSNPARERGAQAALVEPPLRSAVERPQAAVRVSAANLLEVLVTVYRTHRHLAKRSMKDNLDRLTQYRSRHASQPANKLTRPARAQLLDAVSIYRRARLFVPIKLSCHLDSLAMVHFLARRGLAANIVFGVTSDPFSAHCWVQTGDLVLSDSVGNANAYTPIRIV